MGISDDLSDNKCFFVSAIKRVNDITLFQNYVIHFIS